MANQRRIILISSGFLRDLKVTSCAVVVLLVISVVTFAEESSTGTKAKQPLQSEVSILGFTASKTPMAVIEAKLGEAPQFHSTGEHEVEEICYVSPGADKTVVEFKTSWEEGWTNLVSFAVTSGPVRKPWAKRCRIAPEVTAQIATPGGLRLQIAKRAVIAKFGAPDRIENGTYVYHWEHARKPTEEEWKRAREAGQTTMEADSDITAVTELRVRFSDAEVAWFSMYYSETL